ncbi:hypothetical protein Dtox_3539 [Desulfofarcimen acetoxidans DSM 771]|uniref:Uncharacterized protein n=1 Tax=Desulfofarcimen acetoxidans (strain ATCC 49208 / DSM 771 / KCTC 5769 / VKM B-1644 / 5575) TaxID=485916 RepID=C8VVW8_DESAS|nr:hypothetical protein [Desulfofarcimen acetoxidans]ACV64255.1 hypothetical protein Dtox_3539 [Desulfofarcimen acetoxidans DSM 771]
MSLSDEIRKLHNFRVQISTKGLKQDIIIVEVADEFIRGIDLDSGNVKIFPLQNIDFIKKSTGPPANTRKKVSSLLSSSKERGTQEN